VALPYVNKKVETVIDLPSNNARSTMSIFTKTD